MCGVASRPKTKNLNEAVFVHVGCAAIEEGHVRSIRKFGRC
jgi:hypothetical protein